MWDIADFLSKPAMMCVHCVVCEEHGEADDNAADAGDDVRLHPVIPGCQMLRV